MIVTVKGYPTPSRRHGETVCVAGIKVAPMQQPEWIRLWPVTYRDLDYDMRFKKYQRITLKASRGSDSRPESWRPNLDSLVLHEELSTKNAWASRRQYVDPLEAESMCEIYRRQEVDGTSLGAFRPADVDLEVTHEGSEWSPEQAAQLDQPSLFFPNKDVLEKIPYRFRYTYRCSDRQCGGHAQTIIDWELAQAYRSWSTRYGTEAELIDKIRQRWVAEMCAATKDTRFFVGNQHQHPKSFLVLGVFWPPKI